MQKVIGEKICNFSMNEAGKAQVAITFPRAKIFKPQADGSIKVVQGERTITHTAESLDKLIKSCKNPGDLPFILKNLSDFKA
ncbi:MAG: hypothetical protein CMH30_01345 [Micavibrio sp.]|nr:hypothetical protein [Micavibrio sp.]|tara:strand:- start:2344 stop:2589 length:246 start_codon:yes stop_codon:yes gene_type:complete